MQWSRLVAHGMDATRYALVTEDDLAKHVGERIRIEGKTVSAGHRTVTVTSDTKSEVENGKDIEVKSGMKQLTSPAVAPPSAVEARQSFATRRRLATSIRGTRRVRAASRTSASSGDASPRWQS